MVVNPDAELLGVGEIRMVRTFRVGPDGDLFPVNTVNAWRDGWNTAECGRGYEQAAPASDCRCGFYLYSDPAYVLTQPPGRQVLAVCAVNGAMQTGTRGARVERARIDAVWLGPRVSDHLAAAAQRRYPSVGVYRDRAAMDAQYPLTHVDGFRQPRVRERGRRRWRAATWFFLAIVAVLGCLPPHLVVTSMVGAVVWLAALAVGFTLLVTALAQRSPVIALQGMASVAWLVTAGPHTLGQVAARALFVVPMLCVAAMWWRAETPGQKVRSSRLDTALRRWREPYPRAR